MKYMFLIFSLFAFEALSDDSLFTKELREELREKKLQNAPLIESALTSVCGKSKIISNLCRIAKEECKSSVITNPNIVASFCAAQAINMVVSLLEFCKLDTTCANAQRNKARVIANMAQLPANYIAGFTLCEPLYRLKSESEELNHLKNELAAINPILAHIYDYTSLTDCIILASK
jgi:phosphopentomutase